MNNCIKMRNNECIDFIIKNNQCALSVSENNFPYTVPMCYENEYEKEQLYVYLKSKDYSK